MQIQVKYPDIEVELVGQDGNAFYILGRVQKEMTRNGVPADEIKRFTKEAMSGDYDNLLRTVTEWVVVR